METASGMNHTWDLLLARAATQEEYRRKRASKPRTKNSEARTQEGEKCGGIAECTGNSVKRTRFYSRNNSGKEGRRNDLRTSSNYRLYLRANEIVDGKEKR